MVVPGPRVGAAARRDPLSPGAGVNDGFLAVAQLELSMDSPPYVDESTSTSTDGRGGGTGRPRPGQGALIGSVAQELRQSLPEPAGESTSMVSRWEETRREGRVWIDRFVRSAESTVGAQDVVEVLVPWHVNHWHSVKRLDSGATSRVQREVLFPRRTTGARCARYESPIAPPCAAGAPRPWARKGPCRRWCTA